MGQNYNFDPMMLAAQGFQESKLDQNAKSPGGAIGVMQVMPQTGRELKVGDIRITEPNIHAGAKYLDSLMSKDFGDAHFDAQNRALFAFASYNAGPGKIASLRRAARAEGLDPDKWFNNVEIVAARKIGIETTTYVRSISSPTACSKKSARRPARRSKTFHRQPAGKNSCTHPAGRLAYVFVISFKGLPVDLITTGSPQLSNMETGVYFRKCLFLSRLENKCNHEVTGRRGNSEVSLKTSFSFTSPIRRRLAKSNQFMHRITEQ